MGLMDGKVAIVTGAGRGIGRQEALLLAREGAKVVVNDLGGSTGGDGSDTTPAQQVVDEITAAGGRAVANYANVATFDGGRDLVAQAVSTFGGLDILVNNAGILRDRMGFSMSEEEWDAVIAVHLKGHFCPTRFAVEHWRNRFKETDEPVNAKIVNTSSEAGLYGNAGQLNYAAAKAGIAAMTLVEAREMGRYGVRANAIAPVARTRLLGTVGMGETGSDEMEEPLDRLAPQNVAACVAWLCSDLSDPITGQVFKIAGGLVQVLGGWRAWRTVRNAENWTIETIDKAKGTLFNDRLTGVPPFHTEM